MWNYFIRRTRTTAHTTPTTHASSSLGNCLHQL